MARLAGSIHRTGRGNSGSSVVASKPGRVDQMPAMGHRSSPVSTKVRVRRTGLDAGALDVPEVRRVGMKIVSMGYSFLRLLVRFERGEV